MSNYPPGAANDPYAPYNEPDPPCFICGKDDTHCQCPECPGCGEYGDPDCYGKKGHLEDQEPVEVVWTLEDLLRYVEPGRKERDPETMKKIIARRLYKSTDCGISFYWSGPEVLLTGYCEGTDREVPPRILTIPFTMKQFWQACDLADKDGIDLWNETHGCENCWPNGYYDEYGIPGECGDWPINLKCPHCGGEGIIL